MLLDVRKLIAERLIGDRRKTAEFAQVRQEHGQVANETVLRKRFLDGGRGPQNGVEQSAVVDDSKRGFFLQRRSLLLHKPPAQFQNHVWNRYLGGTDSHTVAALDAQALNLLGLLQLVKQRRENGPDAAGVDLAEDVAAHQAKHGTNIQARAAADALQRLLEHRIVRHLGPVVIHQDDVQVLQAAVGIG